MSALVRGSGANEAVRRVEADANRSADTHLHTFHFTGARVVLAHNGHLRQFPDMRRLASLFTARLRNQLRHLAVSLGGEMAGPPAEDAAGAFADLEDCRPPDSKCVRRMATFHDFDPLALWGFLTSGSYVRCPPGRTLLAEGAPSTAYYLTINGAVEKLLVRGNWRIRVGLVGPGRAFG